MITFSLSASVTIDREIHNINMYSHVQGKEDSGHVNFSFLISGLIVQNTAKIVKRNIAKYSGNGNEMHKLTCAIKCPLLLAKKIIYSTKQ